MATIDELTMDGEIVTEDYGYAITFKMLKSDGATVLNLGGFSKARLIARYLNADGTDAMPAAELSASITDPDNGLVTFSFTRDTRPQRGVRYVLIDVVLETSSGAATTGSRAIRLSARDRIA